MTFYFVKSAAIHNGILMFLLGTVLDKSAICIDLINRHSNYRLVR